MKNFLRSLRYLWPYRGRLAVACVCVLLIGVLWAGGLGALLPAVKILISPEGLHGWAYNAMTRDRLSAHVVQRVVPTEGNYVVDGQKITIVLDVVETDSNGPAATAGIAKTEWLIGADIGDRREPVLRGDELAERIADAGDGQTIRLHVYNPLTRQVRWVEVCTGEVSFAAGLLGKIVRYLPRDRYELLLWLLIGLAAATVLRNFFRFVQEYLVETAVLRGLMDLRCDNYNLVLHLPVTFFSQKGTTDAMSRFIQDSNELARGQTTLLSKTLVEPVKAIGSIVVALLISWKLALLAMVAGPPVFILIRKLGKLMKKASRRALESWSSMLAVLEETLTGIRVVKAYTMEASERKRFFRVNRQLYKQQRRMARIDASIAPSVECLGLIAAMGAVALAGYWVLVSRTMSPDALITLLAALGAMFDPLRKLSKVTTRFQSADSAAARIFELADETPEVRQPGAPSLPRLSRSLELRGVHYRYPGAAVEALKDVNLQIQAGETVAIVGPNGSGKTTLVSLIPRLLEPTAGAVYLDGHNVAEYSYRSLRRQIGLVTQETVLFNATIAENISYGLRRPRREKILDASQRAFVDEFVQALPDGYDTMVGEHGATLSGGQRQRIAIARAILRDPAILIFDEAMSQVDADSERRIHQAMAEFVRGRTALLIAHRFATVLSASRIVVMDGGRVLDVGRHEELLERCELYHHLYHTQFVDSGG